MIRLSDTSRHDYKQISRDGGGSGYNRIGPATLSDVGLLDSRGGWGIRQVHVLPPRRQVYSHRDTVTVVTEEAWSGVPDTRFGEQGGVLSYGRYLRLADLLAAQHPGTDPPAHDELLFITIHQVYELWFKLVLFELTDARDRLLDGDPYLPRLRLGRCHTIEQVLVRQVDVIDSMTPQDFLVFRNKLAPASGFQSVQFREIEFLSGAKDPDYVRRFRALTDQERARLEQRLAEPSLWDGFLATLRHAGFDTDTAAQRSAGYLAIAHDRARYGPLWDLSEALLDHDQAWSLWRARHVLMAERQIGTKRGTGGSAGGAYLRSRLELRFYPELWELRSHL